MPRLVLLRHGQSLWNREGRFTGWTDVDLSSKGAEEAREAGRILKSRGYTFDEAYTSVLKRAIRTLWLVLDEMDLMWIPTYTCWQLNERCYGKLEGRSKREIEEIYGAEQVHRWRRGFRDLPPALENGDSRYLRDPKYRRLRQDQIPRTESLEDTLIRLLPCWKNGIVPQLRKGKSIFIVAHGNTLRALVKHLDGLSDEEIEKVEMPTGIPLVYELDGDLLPIAHFYLQSD
jgi:2,3-bisphosphoglycerate-dependent phosphoglycerate mutase